MKQYCDGQLDMYRSYTAYFSVLNHCFQYTSLRPQTIRLSKSAHVVIFLGHLISTIQVWSQSFLSLCIVPLQIVIGNWNCTHSVLLWYIDTSSCSILWFVFTLIHVIGWTLILGSTLLMDAYELLGLKQVSASSSLYNVNHLYPLILPK